MIRALSLDAGGTLLHVREPVALTYARVAEAHGHPRSVEAVRAGLLRVAGQPWEGRRYVGDGRSFWRAVVAEAIGTGDPVVFEALYAHYTLPEAWMVSVPALRLLDAARRQGWRTALASNWDSRLRPLLGSLDLVSRFDHVHISAEVEAEKPDRAFFLSLADALDLSPEAITHLGDEPVADVEGARAAGLRAALWAGGEPYPSVGLEPEP